jgi:hypothetical protein
MGRIRSKNGLLASGYWQEKLRFEVMNADTSLFLPAASSQ